MVFVYTYILYIYYIYQYISGIALEHRCQRNFRDDLNVYVTQHQPQMSHKIVAKSEL